MQRANEEMDAVLAEMADRDVPYQGVSGDDPYRSFYVTEETTKKGQVLGRLTIDTTNTYGVGSTILSVKYRMLPLQRPATKSVKLQPLDGVGTLPTKLESQRALR
eukprot:scaffold304_cov409-Prasinococcus_capsulatus_cf.AAC.3